jgi:DeoR/GlpR family transcriptional regulator of sugar metabolism
MKTNKHQTLLLVSNQRVVHSRDLVQHFGYSPGTARSYLSYLGRQGLLERMGASYGLTQKGQDRLHFFDVSGCADAACPLCQKKKGYLTCHSCGYQMAKRTARILKEKDFFFVVRHPGVYCDGCFKLIFNEAHARLLGIPAEE